MLNWKITDDFGGKDNVALSVDLEDYPYEAYIKWDGCCEVTNTETEERMHICDIDAFVKVLQSLEDFRLRNIDGAE